MDLPQLLPLAQKNAKDLPNKPLRICTDSRQLVSEDVFLALKGPHFDGHGFCADAIQKGVTALIVSDAKFLNQEVPCFCVEDTLVALQDLAKAYRHTFKGPVVAITGSSGKTSTKELLKHVLGHKFEVSATYANHNNEIGVALSLLDLKPSDEVAVLELGINQIGEMDCLGAMVQPDWVVITHIHPSHLEGMLSLETIAQEKTALLKYARPDGKFVYHQKEPLLQPFVRSFEGIVCAVQDDDELVNEPATANWSAPMKKNAALVRRVAEGLGMASTEIGHTLQSFAGVLGRFMVRSIEGVQFVDDSYNANPESFRESLRALACLPGERVFVCIGDMKELGLDSDKWHRYVWEDVIALQSDGLVVVGPLMNQVYQSCYKDTLVTPKLKLVENVEQAILQWDVELQKGDIVYVKGSRAMKLERWLEHVKDQYESMCGV